jgi:ATP-dependent Clp protease ATP-binding subunit ClpC
LIQKEIEDPISMEILKGSCTSGTRMMVSMRKGKIQLTPKKPQPVPDKASVQS